MNIMKTRRLARRVTLNSVVMTLVVYFFMQTITYFRDNIIYGLSTTRGFLETVGSFIGPYVLPPTLIFGLVIYFIVLKLQKVQERLEAGETLSRELAEKTRLRLIGFSRFILVFNLIGFAAGFVVLLIMTGRFADILRPDNLVILTSNLMGGIIYASAQTALNDTAFSRLRELLGIREINDRKKERRSTLKQFILSVCLAVYAVTFIQFNNRDMQSAQTVGFDILKQVQSGQLSKEEAVPAYRKNLGQRMYLFSTRKGMKLEEAAAIPWERKISNIDVQQRVFFLMALFALTVTAAVQVIVSSEMKRQIESLKSRIKEAVGGGRDLTKRLSIIHMDDFGELTELINLLLDQFQSVVGRIAVSADETRRSAAEIDRVLRESERISHSTSDSVLALGSELGKQAAESRALTALIESFRQAVSGVEAAAETQNQFAAETSSAMEEMASNIKSVESMTERSGQLTERLSTQGSGGGQAVKETAVAINEIAQSASKVADVLVVLKKIAADINLLAMNAAIEAAHAGDKGMGFAVVADEVRRLASTAAEQTKSIGAFLKTMTEKVRQGVSRAEASGGALDELIAGIRQSASISREISDAMKEQSSGTGSVARNLDKVLEASKAIRERTQEQADQTTRMTASLGDALRNIEELATSSKAQSDQILALEESFMQVRKEVNANLDAVKALSAEVDGFKV
jgi:methyl-accepting chemotaxis protein